MSKRASNAALIACVVWSGVAVGGQSVPGPPWFTDVLPAEEFAARRGRLLTEIGDAVAILQGAAERPAEAPFRQNSQFENMSALVPIEIDAIERLMKEPGLRPLPNR